MTNESTHPPAVPQPPKPLQPAQAAQAVLAQGAPPKSPGRRKFLSWFTLAWTAFTAATLGALSLCLRFMFPNVLFEPPMSFKAGFPDAYDIGTVDERWKVKFGVWMVRTAQGLYALSTTCTHLGCTPNWLAGENKFKCPCHGSGFYKTGINFEGPAPRPLERYRISLTEDGQVLVDKSKKYQQEKGEWNDPGAFLPL
jgi:cytochrome b6-f complex iron-sulfur subunit